LSNPAKAKGTAFESLIRDALNGFWRGRFGLKAYRPAQEGHLDTGDLHGVSPFIVQAKNYRDVASALREGLNGAVVQAERAGEDYGVAVIKRARRPIGEAAAVMRLEDWARLVLRLRRAEELLDASTEQLIHDHRGETAADLAEPFPRS
jgi:hypothetical protein